MEKRRNMRMVSVIFLAIAIIGVTIGFAAFNASLTITNTNASGTKADNDANFKDKLIITNVACDGDEDSYEVGNISTDSFSWSGAKVNLSAPNATITCTATVKNNSSYIAYLNSIELAGNITCGKVTEEGQSVTAACNGLELKVNGNVSGKAEATATTTRHTNAANVTGDSIAAGGTGKISFTVTYNHTTVLDADYSAALPTMTFNYSTVD